MTFVEHHWWRDSRIHLVKVDLDLEEVRVATGAEYFPFGRVYPVTKNIDMGAELAVGGGFNTTLYHKFEDRVPDEPLHALVLNNEIWITGVGNGGAGIQLHGTWATATEANSIDVRLSWWDTRERPHVRAELVVGSVNHGHENKVAAFTDRGGTNEMAGIRVVFDRNGRHNVAIEGKHYVVLRQVPGEWMDVNSEPGPPGSVPLSFHEAIWSSWHKDVVYVGTDVPRLEYPSADVILECKWKPPLEVGQRVRWSQRTGGPTVVSGWPMVLKEGKNVVPLLNLHGEASHGPDNWFIRKNPRMVIGVSKENKTLFICVVEGRIPNPYSGDQEPSKGLRLKELATWLANQGVWEAVNFDGGGSPFLWGIGGLIAPGCYNTSGQVSGLRPDHYSIGVFNR